MKLLKERVWTDEIEKLTEKLANQLCKDAGQPTSLSELFLSEAYNAVYFWDTDDLLKLVIRAKATKEYKKAIS